MLLVGVVGGVIATVYSPGAPASLTWWLLRLAEAAGVSVAAGRALVRCCCYRFGGGLGAAGAPGDHDWWWLAPQPQQQQQPGEPRAGAAPPPPSWLLLVRGRAAHHLY